MCGGESKRGARKSGRKTEDREVEGEGEGETSKAALKEEAYPDLQTSPSHSFSTGSLCFQGQSPLL